MHIDGLMQERYNSIANAPELSLSCTNPQYMYHWPIKVNSLAPKRCASNFTCVMFKHILVIDSWNISCKNVCKLMPQDLTDEQTIFIFIFFDARTNGDMVMTKFRNPVG